MNERRLNELGERKIIKEILSPLYSSQSLDFGDDCAMAELSEDTFLAITTDPCPYPMAWQLGFTRYYYMGWLLSTLNISDLASKGASPLGMVTSIILPATTLESDFTDLLQGINDCANRFQCPVIGGNLKEADQVSLSATAFGLVKKKYLVSRRGARPGDVVALVGDMGLFWAAYFARTSGLKFEKDVESLLFRNILCPEPKLPEGQLLTRSGMLTSCMDNSDGLYPSLLQICDVSNVSVVLEADAIEYPPIVASIAKRLEMSPLRFLLGWGDWQLLVTLPSQRIDEATSILSNTQYKLHIVGRVIDGNGKVFINMNGSQGLLYPLDSQRFSADSWFTAGLSSYVDTLASCPLML